MILITDSGSTKCSWALCDKHSNILFKCETIGFNPYFIDQEKILETLNNSGLTEYKNEVEKVYFYGAGCSSDEKNKIIHKPLDIFFKNALGLPTLMAAHPVTHTPLHARGAGAFAYRMAVVDVQPKPPSKH